MKTAFVLGILTLLILAAPSVFGQTKPTLDQQKACADQAQTFEARKPKDIDIWEITNHFDNTTQTCYVMTYAVKGMGKDGVYRAYKIFDAFEGRVYGDFSQLHTVLTSSIHGQHPSSDTEFLELADRYFGIKAAD